MNEREITTPDNSSLEGTDTLAPIEQDANAPAPQLPGRGPRKLLREIIIGLVLLALIAGGTFLTNLSQKNTSKTTQTVVVNTQSLDSGTLNKLTSQPGHNGGTSQQLTISPSTLFKSDVTIQEAATLQNNLTVKGDSNLFGPVATGGNLSIGGGLSVNHNATVGGNVSVSGQISAGSLSVGTITPTDITASGNISWGGHLISAGTLPTVRPDTAAGNGTTTITGNDSAGTVTINTGSSVLPSGVLAMISFYSPYALAPRIQLTPANAQAASLLYYAASHATFFQVDAAANIAANTSYQFYYLVTQ